MPTNDSENQTKRLLLVDDDELVTRAYARLLERDGYEVTQASSGNEAMTRIEKAEFDVILSDISMPGMSGLEFLRSVRAIDPDLPVILMTGVPSVATAIGAVEYGALRYLLKPIASDTLRESAGYAMRMRLLARARRGALDLHLSGDITGGDRAKDEAAFERVLATLWVAYQPIISYRNKDIYGFEALVRVHEESIPHPGVLFEVAGRLGRLRELSRLIRGHVANTVQKSTNRSLFFVNLHPYDLGDPELHDTKSPLAQVANRVVLEVTERATLEHISDVRACVDDLRRLGFRIAIDDLGAGYSGLNSFAQIEPELVKLDMCLIRDVHNSLTKQKLIASMTSLCRELGSQVVAEGVETMEECAKLEELSCDLMQGFLFARPDKPFPTVKW